MCGFCWTSSDWVTNSVEKHRKHDFWRKFWVKNDNLFRAAWKWRHSIRSIMFECQIHKLYNEINLRVLKRNKTSYFKLNSYFCVAFYTWNLSKDRRKLHKKRTKITRWKETLSWSRKLKENPIFELFSFWRIKAPFRVWKKVNIKKGILIFQKIQIWIINVLFLFHIENYFLTRYERQ